MMSYVAFKNLMIGAALFLVLQALGLFSREECDTYFQFL